VCNALPPLPLPLNGNSEIKEVVCPSTLSERSVSHTKTTFLSPLSCFFFLFCFVFFHLLFTRVAICDTSSVHLLICFVTIFETSRILAEKPQESIQGFSASFMNWYFTCPISLISPYHFRGSSKNYFIVDPQSQKEKFAKLPSFNWSFPHYKERCFSNIQSYSRAGLYLISPFWTLSLSNPYTNQLVSRKLLRFSPISNIFKSPKHIKKSRAAFFRLLDDFFLIFLKLLSKEIFYSFLCKNVSVFNLAEAHRISIPQSGFMRENLEEYL